MASVRGRERANFRSVRSLTVISSLGKVEGVEASEADWPGWLRRFDSA